VVPGCYAISIRTEQWLMDERTKDEAREESDEDVTNTELTAIKK
jgi:hypothetical protein